MNSDCFLHLGIMHLPFPIMGLCRDLRISIGSFGGSFGGSVGSVVAVGELMYYSTCNPWHCLATAAL